MVWIMANHVVPVVMNHAVLCWASRWDSRIERCASGCDILYVLCLIYDQYNCKYWIYVYLYVVWHWLIKKCNWIEIESCCAMLSQSLWITVFYAEPVVVNHCELCWASGCETLWVIRKYWLWIIVSYAEPVVVNHCVLCWAGYVGIIVCYAGPVVGNHDVNAVQVGVNQCVMLSQWLWITLCYVVPVVVNHGELCGGSGCESCCVFMCQ
jgi:hypothetical protein